MHISILHRHILGVYGRICKPVYFKRDLAAYFENNGDNKGKYENTHGYPYLRNLQRLFISNSSTY